MTTVDPTSNHPYNLRPTHTKRNIRYNMTQLGQQSAIAGFAQPHAHLMMTQMSIREGIQRFRDKGNDALLKNRISRWWVESGIFKNDLRKKCNILDIH